MVLCRTLPRNEPPRKKERNDAGRERVCEGACLDDDDLMLMISCSLWTFDVPLSHHPLFIFATSGSWPVTVLLMDLCFWHSPLVSAWIIQIIKLFSEICFL